MIKKNNLKIIFFIFFFALLSCGSNENTPYDPKNGNLFEQRPNSDGEALKICCGHDPENCKPNQSPRC